MIVPYNTGSREEVKAALSRNFGRRMAEARETCGMTQLQAAAIFGFKNSSRLCKVESSDYGSLMHVYLIPMAVRVYDTSADFLLGLSDWPQRDVKQARKSQIQALLADSIASELAEIRSIAKALDEIAELNQRFEKKSQEALQALIRFEELNPGLDEMPGGSKIATLVHELRQDVKRAADKLAGIRESLKAAPTSNTQ